MWKKYLRNDKEKKGDPLPLREWLGESILKR